MNNTWQDKIKHAPRAPGVYLMKDGAGKVIYIGKAKDLRARIRAYANGTDARFMIPFLTSRIEDLETIVTQTEKEALILENNLIKEHLPKYNVNLRDDKTYYSIRMDLKQTPFPRFQLVRQVKKDGARYFGPYPSSSAAKETLRYLQPIFPLRTCGDRELSGRTRPCLEYQIRRCLAPCVGLTDSDAYGQIVRDSIAFLEGREKGLIAELGARMKAASARLNFEEAGALRDRIAALQTTVEKQRIVSAQFKDQDVFGLHREGNKTQALVLYVRKGKLVGKKTFLPILLAAETGEILSSLMTQYYAGNVDIPAEIIVPQELEDAPLIAEWLTERAGKTVNLFMPQKGPAKDLLRMAESNSAMVFETERKERDTIEAALGQLADKLGLKNRPGRIECFDISNVSGQYAVGSLVTFLEGRPWKEGYRRFRIKTLKDMDDYGMLREVLSRRYGKKEDLPDLLVVDGGKGQLSVALTLLKDLQIDKVDVIALAKKREGAPPSRLHKDEDRVYLPRRKEPVYISRWPSVLFLMQQVRDEAHRFALAYHHKLKEKIDFHSLLDEIPGIADSRKKLLLTHFGDLSRIKSVTEEELQQVKGIGKRLGSQIYAFFQRNPS